MERKQKIGLNMTEGSILKTLLVFAVPILLTNLIQQLYNTVDLIVIGKFVGNEGTVGVSTGGDLINFITMLSIGFSSAGQVYVSQQVGARDYDNLKKTIGTLLSVMMGASLVFAAVGAIVAEPFLRMMNCPEEAFSQAVDYMRITCIGAPFIYGYNAVCGILRGMGESKRPMIFVIIAAVSNIIMDLLFVVAFRMEAAGTALATVIAQFASFAAAFVFMYRKREHFDFDFKLSSFRIHKKPLLVLLRLGIPRALQSSLINVSLLFCSSRINAFGIIASATNSVGNKITRFANIITQSVDTGAATMIGQNLGARKNDRAKKTVHVALAIALGVAAVNSLAAIFAPRLIFSIFTNDPEVIEFGVTFMHISIITFILAAVMGPYQAMITGSGNASLGFLVGILDGVVLRIGLSLLFGELMGMGVVGYFYGNALPRLAPCIIGIIYFYTNAWEKRRLLTE